QLINGFKLLFDVCGKIVITSKSFHVNRRAAEARGDVGPTAGTTDIRWHGIGKLSLSDVPFAVRFDAAARIHSGNGREFIGGKILVFGNTVRVRAVLAIKGQLAVNRVTAWRQFDDVLVARATGDQHHQQRQT